MNQLLDRIKVSILDAFDNVVDFCSEKWEEQRILCIAVLACVFLIIFLLVLIPVLSQDKMSPADFSDIPQVEIEPFLSIPEEPRIEDDYVITRKNVNHWSSEAVEKWFTEPDDEMLDDLQKANEKLIDDMLEVVP